MARVRSPLPVGAVVLLLGCRGAPDRPAPAADAPGAPSPSTTGGIDSTTLDSAATESAAPATNLLLLVIDDVGVDRFALYGAEHAALTPVLDALAAGGMVFENAWSMSVCAPTRAALQTGRYPRRTGWGANIDVLQGTAELDPSLLTLAELVALSPVATYASSYVGKWHLAAFESASTTLGPLVQGWDWWTGSMANLDIWRGPNPAGPIGFYGWQKVDPTGLLAGSTTYATTDNVDDALARVAAMPEPWLLQVSFNAAHHPYHVPPPGLHTNLDLSDSSSTPDKHRGMIEAVDTAIGGLLAGIPPDVLARTTTFFLGDNGSPLVTLNAEASHPGRSKGTLYDGGVRVPFVVAGPLVGVPGSRSSVLVSVVDVFPTVAAIAGVDTGALVLDGVSLLPTMADPAAPTGRTTLYAEQFQANGPGPYHTDRRAIRNDRYKLLVDVACETEEFFEYTPEVWDEGRDLLPLGLTADQQAAYDALHAELDALAARLVYEASGWPAPKNVVPLCDGDTADTGIP